MAVIQEEIWNENYAVENRRKVECHQHKGKKEIRVGPTERDGIHTDD